MSSHDASAQMLGYLYQVRCALNLLLSAENEQSSICIEKFDDVAFSNDGETADVLIQTKHHVNNRGDLTDSSVDLWRTLNVWMDMLRKQDIINTRFIIITTSNAPDNAASWFMRPTTSRDSVRAYAILKSIAEQAANASNKRFYDTFLSIDEAAIKSLLDRITVIDKSESILNVVDSIKKSIRYSSRPEFEERVFERIEGWWFKKTIEALCSSEPIFVSQGQVRSYICDVSDEYTPDNLPIDTELIDDIDVNSFPPGERIFCEQLRLVAVRSPRIKIAIRDYYRAFTQRSNWIKDDLLYIDELDQYEGRLIDEWQHLFTRMQDDVNADDDKEKQKAGRLLFGSIEDKDIRIRPQCSDAFVMRGSYHMLANRLKVGWHLDFAQRLELLLTTEG
jgi:hypothetical protein